MSHTEVELFGPDIHDELGPAWRPVEPPMLQVIMEVVRALDISAPPELIEQSCWSSANSQNYRLWPARIVLKRMVNADRLVRCLTAMRHLPQEYGFPALLGGPIKYVDAMWTAFEWHPGFYFRLTEHLDTHLLALKENVEVLAKLPSTNLDRWLPWEAPVPAATDVQVHVEEVAQITGWLMNYACVPTHIDLHPHNLLVDGSRLTLLDHESIRVSVLPVALGYAVFKLARRCIRSLISKWSPRSVGNWVSKALVPDIPPALVWGGAKAELLRRLAFIEIETAKGRTDWILDAKRHWYGLREIDAMRPSSFISGF